MSDHQTLSDLLGDLFKPDELTDWIRRLPDGEDLPQSLKDSSPATLAVDAEHLLRRHGLIDAALFDGLVKARRRREREIRALQHRLLGAPPAQVPPEPPAKPGPSLSPPAPSPFTVQVVCAGAGLKLASGALIAPGVVLTARHVLKDGDRGLWVRPDADGATVTVSRVIQPDDDPDLDVSLLVLAEELAAKPAPVLARALRDAEAWEAGGYPALVDKAQNTRFHAVSGQTVATPADAERCKLAVGRGPACWAGLSGAAVRIRGTIVAVVRSAPPAGEGGPMLATPVGRFTRARWYRDAMGLSEAHAALEGEAARVAAELRRSLEDRAGLRGVLREILELPSDEAQVVAEALVRARADRVVDALYDAFQRVETQWLGASESAPLWEILERVLPHAIDWQQTVTAARSQILRARLARQPEPASFELAWRTETVAEAVLAALDGRRCQYVPLGPDGPLAGAGFLCWPMADHAPLRRTPELLRDAVLQKLASELGVDAAVVVERLAADTRVSLAGETIGILQAIEARLKFNLKDRHAPVHRRHLLVIDDEQGGPEGGLRAWEVAQSALGRHLPSLRLVRLTGSPEQRGPETAIIAPVEALYRAREPK